MLEFVRKVNGVISERQQVLVNTLFHAAIDTYVLVRDSLCLYSVVNRGGDLAYSDKNKYSDVHHDICFSML